MVYKRLYTCGVWGRTSGVSGVGGGYNAMYVFVCVMPCIVSYMPVGVWHEASARAAWGHVCDMGHLCVHSQPSPGAHIPQEFPVGEREGELVLVPSQG